MGWKEHRPKPCARTSVTLSLRPGTDSVTLITLFYGPVPVDLSSPVPRPRGRSMACGSVPHPPLPSSLLPPVCRCVLLHYMSGPLGRRGSSHSALAPSPPPPSSSSSLPPPPCVVFLASQALLRCTWWRSLAVVIAVLVNRGVIF